MSKFAKRPVDIKTGVTVKVDGAQIEVTGPKGTLKRAIPAEVKVEVKDNQVFFTSNEKTETIFGRAILGTTKSHVTNMIDGVTNGWSRKLELVGTGYRAEVRGNELILTLGFSHPVSFKTTGDIKFTVEKNVVQVEGTNIDEVMQLAAKIRASRQPDPYKGKGVRYLGEILKLKPGKQAAKAAA